MATNRVRSLNQLRADLDNHVAKGNVTKARNTAVRMARYGKELKTGRVLAAHKRWQTRKANVQVDVNAVAVAENEGMIQVGA